MELGPPGDDVSSANARIKGVAPPADPLRGANRTFVEPTLGLAQRVILRINDVAVAHDGNWWWLDGSDLVLAARLARGLTSQDWG